MDNIYIGFARRWWWLMAASAVIALAATHYAIAQQKPLYRAIATIQVGRVIESKNPDQAELAIIDRLVPAYAELAKRDPVLLATIQTLNLPLTPNDLRARLLVAPVPRAPLIDIAVVDADPARAAAERRAGRPVYFGNSAHPDLLRACGIETARALVVTLDAPSAIEAVVAAARAARPDLTVVARARDARHAMQLYDLGVDDAVPETIEASLQLSEAVLVDIGVPMGHVIASVHERRDEFRAVLKRKNGTRDPARTEFRARRTAGKRAS